MFFSALDTHCEHSVQCGQSQMDAIEEAEMPEITFRVDAETKQKLKEIAAANDRTLTSEARRILRMYVRDYREIDRG